MLGGKDAAATLAVGDLDRARDFYENTLGLIPADVTPGSVTYRSGNTVVLVYPSTYAGTNKATAASWAVGDDFDSIVEGLRSKGVQFEHYDGLPDTTREGDVHVMGDLKGAWLKDPDAPGSWEASYEPLAIDGETHVASGSTQYFDPDRSVRDAYSNVFVCAFDGAGRCRSFVEWYVRTGPPKPDVA